jgi:hypothetical protein
MEVRVLGPLGAGCEPVNASPAMVGKITDLGNPGRSATGAPDRRGPDAYAPPATSRCLSRLA